VSLVINENNNNNNDYKIHSFYEETNVTFGYLNENTIEYYINTQDPFDKAGGYGIQGVGCSLIKSINGDYFVRF
jgi:septum formation protein